MGGEQVAARLRALIRANGSFALLHRAGRPEVVEILTGVAETADALAELRPDEATSPGNPILAVIPYRQLGERGFAHHDDGVPIRVLRVTAQASAPVADLVASLPKTIGELMDEQFDITDAEYGEIVRKVRENEIGTGQGSNFVISRAFTADIDRYTPEMALAAYRRLLTAESGAYWTFLIRHGDLTFVGASPERHVALADGELTMNPISGTYRYPTDGPTVPDVLRFLADRKETDELYMVVDEELKMMARLCDLGVRAHGPQLRQMARLAHTEYLLAGHSVADPREILRTTMFAPTVTGSPIENACRVIERYEPRGRGYYSGVAALIGADATGPTLDSAILIRTAEIDATGRLRIGVGSTLVRHSDPASEVAETGAKAAALLDAFRPARREGPGPARPRPADVTGEPAVRRALSRRNAHLAGFWLHGPKVGTATSAAGLKALVIDAEDTFTAMLAHQLQALGLEVTIRTYHERFEVTEAGIVVIGPGPGDPRDLADRKTARLRLLTRRLLREGRPFLAVCFGHQVLSGALGLALRRRTVPNQGTQREIDLFGTSRRVGLYNTFEAVSELDRFSSELVAGTVEVCRDRDNGAVHALAGPGFASAQFHPESVLTTDGPAILAELLDTALAVRAAASTQGGDPRWVG
jgi:phenazine biosynthesis protein phzE